MKRQYFGTDGVRGRANQFPITAEFALKLGTAAGRYFGSKHGRFRVVIGKDTRRSCYMLESALTAGLISVGAEVMWLGPVPTPAVGMLTKSMRADLGMMISASHNAYYDNGMKLFGADGFKLSDMAELEIEAMINDYENIPLASPENLGRTIRYDNAQSRYIEIVKASFPKDMSLEGLRIVVDCANGAAYRVAPQILFELGAEVISIGVSPNGSNINDNCGALHTDTLAKKVIEQKADLGIALDGDADRIMMCDEKGNILNGDVIIGMIARNLHRKNMLNNAKVATTVMSNMGLSKFLKRLGIDNIQTAVGDRYVVAAMREQGLNLGGEQSGHVVLSDYATTGDGILAALKILEDVILSKKPLSETSQIFTPFPQILTNIRYKENDPLLLDNVKQEIKKAEQEFGEDGRVFIRKSGTEPLIRVMVEGEDNAMTQKISTHLTDYISQLV